MADQVDLTDEQRAALEAVSAIEAADETASIRAVAERAGLDAHRAEQVLSELTTHDLVREIAIEQQDDATGAGRAYVVKAEPAP